MSSVQQRQTSTRSPPQTLDSLSGPGAVARSQGPVLRGQHHSRVPSISASAWPLDTLLPVTRDSVRHSRPFFTRRLTLLELPDLGRLPWQLPVTRAILRHWTASESFQASYLDSLLHDLLHPEVTALSSVHLAVTRVSGVGDRKLVSWLHRSLLSPVLGAMIEALCYEYIWDKATNITDSQIKSLASDNAARDDVNEDGVMYHFLRDHRRAPPSVEHGSRLYPYSSYLDREMRGIDTRERTRRPPRPLPLRYRVRHKVRHSTNKQNR